MTTLALLAVMLVLLLLKGFFSGAEIALVNCDKVKLNARANQGHHGAKKVLELYKEPDVLLGTTLVGTNLATVALATLGTLLCLRLFGDNGDWYAFFAMLPLLLIFGEIVPKSVYQQKSDQIAPLAIYPLRMFSFLFYPVIFLFTRLTRLLARLFSAGRLITAGDKNPFMTREQIRSVVDMAERTSVVSAFDRGRIRRVIRFAETTVGEAMIPIAEVTAINRHSSMPRAIATVRRTGYNRLPVYRGNISNITGLVTLTTWDLLDPALTTATLEERIAPVHYVLQFQTIDQLLPILHRRPEHMAVVVDEFGSAVGIITLEDIVEEVVGDIHVGYDFDEYLPRRRRVIERVHEGSYLMDSRSSVSEVNDALDISLDSRVSHTIGGLVMAQLGHIPVRGESVVEMGYRFTVEEATDRAIIKLRAEALTV